jgi:hypothetical protein
VVGPAGRIGADTHLHGTTGTQANTQTAPQYFIIIIIIIIIMLADCAAVFDPFEVAAHALHRNWNAHIHTTSTTSQSMMQAHVAI